MFQSTSTSSSAGGSDGGANRDLGLSDGLLSNESPSLSSVPCPSRKWSKIRLSIRFFRSLKKSTSANVGNESPQSSAPYTSLSPSPSRTKSFLAIDICSHAQEEGQEEEQEQQKEEDAEEQRIAGIVKERDLKSLLEYGGVDHVWKVLRGQRQHSELEVSAKPN